MFSEDLAFQPRRLKGVQMYQLIRRGKELRLVARKGKKSPDLFAVDRPVALPGYAPSTRPIPDSQTWRNFVKTGKIRPGLAASHIIASWSRCHKAEVEFAGGACRDILSPRELSKREGSLFEISAPVMDALNLWLKDQPFMVVLVDQDGYIIRSVGDASALRQAEGLNFGPGANWSEFSVGTNAIGTALTIGTHVQVTGREHYNDGHHKWTCAASPILAPNGSPVGCLDISGPMENANPKILEMAKAASLFIEDRIGLEHGWHELLRRKNKIDAVLQMVNEPVLTLNPQGEIVEANQAASRLLGRSLQGLLGRPYQSFFSIGGALKTALEASQGVQGTARIHTGKGTVTGFFNCRGFQDSQGHRGGFLLTLAENPDTRIKAALQQGDPVTYGFADIMGKSRELKQVVEHAKAAAKGDSTVLLLGESGVGKEVFAQAIHQAGARSRKPFVAVNCGAFTKELVQSELFGYTDGAFTGATKGGRPGKLEQADHGTLFLDEVAEMPLEIQVNLLRFLENRTFRRVGGGKIRTADVRIIAATNRDLNQEVEKGNFRRDLFYRLYVVAMEIPSLRKRQEDIPLLALHFLSRLALRQGKEISGFTKPAKQALAAYSWPGNVRELQNALERAVNFCRKKRIGLADLPKEVQRLGAPDGESQDQDILPLAELEKRAILEALSLYKGNVSQTARALGIGRNTLYDKIRRHGIVLYSARGRSGKDICSNSVHP
ncbi:Fis family transcriptional regulator [Dethiosulfatarculus sandiegensis]|uniref:Fis family transcriptional regulator n=2 Tax=Dethiosulfatarculus sandiegensis TaxID=1429043 RepID=A0A0D2JNQ7_9BACT|nr:Fis family transcriptional regulator [Dethiosulfatarculus sandiegensis]